jgi:hypothetical protein
MMALEVFGEYKPRNDMVDTFHVLGKLTVYRWMNRYPGTHTPID